MINLWYRLVDLLVPTSSLYFLNLFILDHSLSEVEIWFVVTSGVLFVFSTQLMGGYDRYAKRTIARKLEVVIKSWLITLFLVVFTAYLLGVVDSIPQTSFLVWAATVPLIVLFLKIKINRICIAKLNDPVKWVLIGNNYEFNDLEKQYLDSQKITIQYQADLSIDSLQDLFVSDSIEGVLLNIKEPADNELVSFLTRMELEGIRLFSMNHFFETYLRKSFISYDVIGVDYLDTVRRLSRSQYFTKRLMDVFLSFSLFVIVIPVVLYSVFRIRKESPGEIIYSQKRVGFLNKEFIVYKFRSMHLDAEKNGAKFAESDDPRAYGFGSIMRKTRIDELPQLWNVIRGDIHFVGPRPEREVFTNMLEQEIPFYHERHLVKPGITGWAQVMYPYGANTEDSRQKLMYDLYYIKHWSIWLEIEVLIRTVRVVLGKKGI